jgi:threonine aldolase
MLRAMASADVGDDTFGEDPTARRLEEAVAESLGVEAALLLLSGTMANLVALMVHCAPGDEVFLDADAHVLRNEAGGLSAIAGVVPTTVAATRGHMNPDALERAVRPTAVFRPRARLAWLENTHNRGGGSVLRPDRQAELMDVARRHGLTIHLDGARLFNAAVALDRPARDLAVGLDSVMLDFTKGLSCGVGAALGGSRGFIAEARRARRVLGGGMRQAGLIAAGCLVALETTVARLADDHAVARYLAHELAGVPGFRVDPDLVETNIVFADVRELGGAERVASALAEAAVRVSTAPPDSIRLVAHRHVDRRAAEVAVGRIAAATAALARPSVVG